MARPAPLALLLLGLLAAAGAADPSIHTVITTECTPYFTWQALGMQYSHRKAGQPGKFTRLMSCTPEEYERLSEAERNLMPTHVAPSYTKHPRTGDVYSAYNKPAAVLDWLSRTQVEEEWILIVDADMVMREPFLPDELGLQRGWAVSAFFGYLKGVVNKLAMKHVPQVLPRNDTFAGPLGRRGDQVGGFTMMHREDLRRVAPLWLKFSEDVRADPDAWELTGDAYSTHPGDKPWISEMYGYSFGASTADVWHKCDHTAMLYPGYDTIAPPKVLHYGLLWEVPGTGYKFDKHWHYDFNPLKCPPWDAIDTAGVKKAGLFPHPPAPSSFKTQGLELLRDLLAVEVVITLNEANCEYLLAHCPPNEQLTTECNTARTLGRELEEQYATLREQMPDPCVDTDERCPTWAEAGECLNNEGFMLARCRLSCKVCKPRAPSVDSGNTGKHKRMGPGAAGGGGVDAAQQAAGGAGMGRTEEAVMAKGEVLTHAPDRTDEAVVAKGEALPRAPERTEGTAVQKGEALTRAPERTGHLSRISQLQLRQRTSAEEAAMQRVGEAAAGGGSADDQVVADLKHRCKTQAGWAEEQVQDCLAQAAQGVKYDPPQAAADEGVVRRESASVSSGGDAAVAREAAPDLGDSEAGQGGLQQAGGGSGSGDAVTEALMGGRKAMGAHRFEKGRLLQERAEAVVSGTAVRLQKHGLLGLLFWASAFALFFCVLPGARHWRKFGRRKSLARMD